MRLAYLAAFVAGGATLPAFSQTQILVAEGDAIPGIGVAHDVFDLAVDDDGNWIASVVVSPPDQPLQQALVHNGTVLLGPADPLPGQPTETFRGAASLELVAGGVPSWTAWLADHPQPLSVGAYRGLEPWIVRGQQLTGPGLPAGFTAHFVFQFRATSADEAYAIVGPFQQLSGTTAIVRIERSAGGALSYEGLVKTGDVLAGPTAAPITAFSKRRHAFAANANGNFAYFVWNPEALCRELTRIVVPFEPTPIAGLTYFPFESSPQALDDSGNHAFASVTSWNKEVLVLNAQAVATTGDALPAIAPFSIDRLYAGTQNSPLFLTAKGLAWFAGWDAPADLDQGVFLGDDLVVRESVTYVAGRRIVDLMPQGSPSPRPIWHASRGGTQIGARVRLDDGRLAAVRVQPQASATGFAGCSPSSYDFLPGIATDAKPGGSFTMVVNPTPPGTTAAWLALSTARIDPSACGIDIPGVGELLVSLEPTHVLGLVPHVVLTVSATGFAPVVVPPLPALSGLTMFGQAVFADASAAGLTLSNGIEIRLGHP